MAKRRVISERVTQSETMFKMSNGAFRVWAYMLAISDDYGVVPGTAFALKLAFVLPPDLADNFDAFVDEVFAAGLGTRFDLKDKTYFMFDPETFDRYQSFFVKNRTQSERLNIKAKKRGDNLLLGKFPENSGRKNETQSYPIESNKYKVESREQKEESQLRGETDNIPAEGFAGDPELDEVDKILAGGPYEIRERKAADDGKLHEQEFIELILPKYQDTFTVNRFVASDRKFIFEIWKEFNTTATLKAIGDWSDHKYKDPTLILKALRGNFDPNYKDKLAEGFGKKSNEPVRPIQRRTQEVVMKPEEKEAARVARKKAMAEFNGTRIPSEA